MSEKVYPPFIFNEFDRINKFGLFMDVEKVIYSGGVTKFQRIDIFETKAFGKVFTLDGVPMTCELDEFVYHEMISHVPLFLHENPKKKYS